MESHKAKILRGEHDDKLDFLKGLVDSNGKTFREMGERYGYCWEQYIYKFMVVFWTIH